MVKGMRAAVTKILLGMAKDEDRAEKDRIKACETLLKMAGEDSKTEADPEIRVIVEYGRGEDAEPCGEKI